MEPFTVHFAPDNVLKSLVYQHRVNPCELCEGVAPFTIFFVTLPPCIEEPYGIEQASNINVFPIIGIERREGKRGQSTQGEANGRRPRIIF